VEDFGFRIKRERRSGKSLWQRGHGPYAGTEGEEVSGKSSASAATAAVDTDERDGALTGVGSTESKLEIVEVSKYEANRALTTKAGGACRGTKTHSP
jgi:hypothetical protein